MRVAERALRSAAIAIALLAIVDPSITSVRRVRPIVSVVIGADGDSALADRARAALRRDYAVIGAPLPSASASVIAGRALPARASALASPIVGVVPESPRVAIVSVEAPPRAARLAPVGIEATVMITDRSADSVDVVLRDGPLAVDQARIAVRALLEETAGGPQSADPSGDSRARVARAALTYVPLDTGVRLLTLTASLPGDSAEPSSVSHAVDVRDRRWRVLFHDARVSWQSTFVRRAVQGDARFVVASRTQTSRGLSASTVSGRPAGGADAPGETVMQAPTNLSDPASVDGFDVIVVGAPELLPSRDVDALERFMRERGGSVVLLFDAPMTGAFDRWVAFPSLSVGSAARASGVGVRTSARGAGSDSAVLRVAEWGAPTPRVTGSDALAAVSRGGVTQPVIAGTHVGIGRLVASGAFDAWRFRDAAQSDFQRYWPSLIAAAAASAIRPLTLSTTSGVVPPHAWFDITVRLREALTHDVSLPFEAHVAAAMLWDAGAPPMSAAADTKGARDAEQSAAGIEAARATASTRPARSRRDSVPIRLYPTEVPGEYRGRVRAPATAGTVRIVATGLVRRARGDGRVDARVDMPTAADTLAIAIGASASGAPDALDARAGLWARSHDGAVVAAGALSELPSTLGRLVQPRAERRSWHPMRSPWWLVPFALALGAEWWLRRRRGAA